MSASFDDVLTGITTKGVASLKDNLGKAWDSLTPQEKADCEILLTDIARARLEEIAGDDISGYLPILEDALLQWKAVASGELAAAMKGVVQDVIGMVVFAGTSALRGLILKV